MLSVSSGIIPQYEDCLRERYGESDFTVYTRREREKRIKEGGG